MVITKHKDVTKQGFCKNNFLKVTPSTGKYLIITYSIIFSGGGGGAGREKGVGTYFRLGAYKLFLPLGWALIRGRC